MLMNRDDVLYDLSHTLLMYLCCFYYVNSIALDNVNK